MERKNILAVASFLLISTIVGLIYLEFFPIFPVVSDSKVFDEAAINFLEGKGLLPTKEEPGKLVYPGYPVFLAVIYKLFGHDYNPVRIIQFMITGLTAGLIYCIALRLGFNKKLSFFSGLAVVFWPYFIVYASSIETEVLFSFTLVLSLSFLLKLSNNPSVKNAALSGFSLGLAALIRTEALLLPLLILFVLFVFYKKTVPFKYFLILFLAFALSLLPWLSEYFSRIQEFMSDFFLQFKSSWDNAYPELEKQSETSYLFSSQIKNFFLFWNPGAGGLRAEALVEKYSWLDAFFVIYRIGFLLILALAFLSARFVKNKKEILLLWTPILYLWGVHTIMYPSPRHTFPIIPFVIILALITTKDYFSKKGWLPELFQS